MSYGFSILLLGASIYLLTTPYYLCALFPALLFCVTILLMVKPEWLLMLVVAVIPFDAFSHLSDRLHFLTVSKLMGLLLLLVLFIQVVVHRERIQNLQSSIWKFMIAFFLANVISALFGINFSDAIHELRRFFTAIIFFASVLFFLNRRLLIYELPWVIILTVSSSSLMAILGYAFNVSIFTVGENIHEIKRGLGGVANPNILSMLISFSMPHLANKFFYSQSIGIKWVCFFLLLIHVAALVITYSRSGALVFGFIIGVIVLYRLKGIRARRLGLAAAVTAVIFAGVLLALPSSFWNRQKTLFNREDRSVNRRFSYLVVAWNGFLENPILGYGPGQFGNLYAKSTYAHAYASSLVEIERAAHNAYVEILTGSGLLGFGFYLSILVFAIRRYQSAKRYFNDRGNIQLSQIITAYQLSFISILFSGLFASLNYQKYLWLSFALSEWVARLDVLDRTSTQSAQSLPAE